MVTPALRLWPFVQYDPYGSDDESQREMIAPMRRDLHRQGWDLMLAYGAP
jgi:hypothetical protein